MAEVTVTLYRGPDDSPARLSRGWQSNDEPSGVYAEVGLLLSWIVLERNAVLEGAEVGITLSTEKQHDSDFELRFDGATLAASYFKVFDMSGELVMFPHQAKICNRFLERRGFAAPDSLWIKVTVAQKAGSNKEVSVG